jgi:Zn-dependent metalloprotease
VFEGSVQIHINPAGEVVAYRDFRIAELSVSPEPKIKKEEAIEIVLQDIGPDQAVTIPGSQLMLYRDRRKRIRLVWQIESVYSEVLQENSVSLMPIQASSFTNFTRSGPYFPKDIHC